MKSDRTNTHEDGKPESQAQFFQVKWTWIITKANGTVLRLILVTGKEPLKHFDLWSPSGRSLREFLRFGFVIGMIPWTFRDWGHIPVYTILPNIWNHVDMIQIPSGNQTWQWDAMGNSHEIPDIYIYNHIYIYTHIYIFTYTYYEIENFMGQSYTNDDFRANRVWWDRGLLSSTDVIFSLGDLPPEPKMTLAKSWAE